MGILTSGEIRKRMARSVSERLVVTPLLSVKQLGEASIDVRLGNEFLLLTRASTSSHDYMQAAESALAQRYKKVRREFGSPLFLHPNQLVLGATLEFVGLPNDLSCYVIGRSSLGRTGLVIATATAVAPGYKGCITLEIVNLGEVPTPLYPGMRIAQLVVHQTLGSAAYAGRFQCSTGPEEPLLWRDREMRLWMQPEGDGGSRQKRTRKQY
jgi:dCTP deaminase